MTPFAQLPQWMDIGPDQDFAAPTVDIVSLLKKRMGRKPQGGVGSEIGGALGDDGNAAMMKAPTGEGVKSL